MTHSNCDGVATIHLEGKLIEPWVGELRALVTSGVVGCPRRLDLAGVTFVDAAGAGLLRTLREGGVEIAACSAFVAELLDSRAGDPVATKSA